MSETTRTLPEWVREPWRLRAGALGAARWLRGTPKRTLLTGAGAAIFVFAAASALRSRTSDAMLLAAVEEGPFEVQIVESGTLQALRSVTYSSTIPGSQAKIVYIVA